MIKKLYMPFLMAMMVACLTACSSKMGELSAEYFTVTPQVLESVGGEVPVTINGKVPEKYFNKKAIVTVTPVLKWEGGEVKGEVIDTYTKSIQTPEDSSISYKVSADEYKAYKDFQKHHKTCKGETQICFTPIAGLGIACKVRCLGCGEEQDITDYNAW